MKKLGFIGCGNMGEAMLTGALRSGWADASDIVVHTLPVERNRELAESYGVKAVESNVAVALEAQLIVLAVKPNIYPDVIEEIAPSLVCGQILLGISPAFSIQSLETLVAQSCIKIARAMPNTPAMVGKGVTGVSYGANVEVEDRILVEGFLASFGEAIEVEEALMGAVCSVSASAPAFIFMLIEAMAQGAIEQGIPSVEAYRFAAATVEGSARLVLDTGKHPAHLRDAVCSAGGTTIAGVNVLEQNGFKGNLIAAMQATGERFQAMEAAASEE